MVEYGIMMEELNYNTKRWRILYKIIREEIKLYLPSGKFRLLVVFMALFFNSSLQIILLYRLGHFFFLKGYIRLSIIIEWFQIILFSCLIASQAEIGRNLRIPHPIGIVIGMSKIGNDVKIWQNVSIGSRGRVCEVMNWPSIEDGVRIFANSVLVGEITIGKNATIGATAFINKNVAPNTTAKNKYFE